MNGNVSIRDAVLSDAEVLVRFNTAIAAETEGKQLLYEKARPGVLAVLQNPNCGFYIVAEVDGKVVGSLMVTFEWSDWRNAAFWWIQSVYVMPEFRRRGIYRTLYETVRKRAGASSKVCGLRLYVERDNTAAQATYAKLGMTEMNYRMYEKLFD
ncbi:MAG: GNAT family N-acetyltransferase [Candidatus Eisenbacteria bacterium]|nr:GNAT family N-acetyltransferase [Candidatus Eisenbacteria bacterium]